MEFSINTVGKIVLVVLVVSLVLVALTIVWDTTWQDVGDEGTSRADDLECVLRDQENADECIDFDPDRHQPEVQKLERKV